MLEQIINLDSLQTPALASKIAGVAGVIGVVLFIITTGFGWMKQAGRAWRGDATDEGFDFDELVRKIALLVLITSFSLITTVITTVINFARDSTKVEYSDLDDQNAKLNDRISTYTLFSYYFNSIKEYQNAPNAASKTAAKIEFFKRYPGGTPKLTPVTDGVFDEIGVSISNTLSVVGSGFSMGFTTLFIQLGQLLSGVFKYFFAIIFQVLLALFPLSLAFSIPKSMENSYSTSIRRIMTVGLSFVVISLLDQFVIQGFSSMGQAIINAFGSGINTDVNQIDSMLFVGLPIYSIGLIGLYASTMWLASSVVGGGDGEGGIATKGMGMAIGVIAAGITATTATAKAGSSIATGGKSLKQNEGS
ncbi:MAG: hypothetical protein AB8F74_19395 [Saprospiraceae bacterium]